MIVYYKGHPLNLHGFWHPGSPPTFQHYQGKEIAHLFEQVGHSDCARQMLLNLAADEASRIALSQLPQLQPDPLQKQIDNKLDFSKPLLQQVKKFTREEYIGMISRPRMHSNLRLFGDETKERDYQRVLHRNLLLYIPLLLLRLCCLPLMMLPLALLMAIITWTLIEYLYHRFLLHNQDDMPENPTPKDIEDNFMGHALHHSFPNYATMLVLHPFETIMMKAVAGMFFLFYGVLRLPLEVTWAIICGLLLGLLVYDWLHYMVHFGELKYGWFQYLKRNHMRHHYKTRQTRFGVTNTFWDWTFHTI